MEAKFLDFSNSKSYVIYFDTPLYNTLNINGSIFFSTSFKYSFFILFYSSSPSLSTITGHTNQQKPTNTSIHNKGQKSYFYKKTKINPLLVRTCAHTHTHTHTKLKLRVITLYHPNLYPKLHFAP